MEWRPLLCLQAIFVCFGLTSAVAGSDLPDLRRAVNTLGGCEVNGKLYPPMADIPTRDPCPDCVIEGNVVPYDTPFIKDANGDCTQVCVCTGKRDHICFSTCRGEMNEVWPQ
ncbi:hypothetical protein LSH36_72g07038 [Paralvinella palmiformis]|uniref:Uncharacterized protein n=1 Tax=Paralvinella palmiformis TaxID=53620 RepID=A0AAD9NB97_9ANNE|nr:hypothetical protein LSH36_72g07038 [Paralvinella palmiformis]